MSSNTSAGRSNCQNCGAPLHGPYCAACGQHDVDYHRSLWPILEDALEGFLHIDGKFFRTVRLLFTRPGFLTQEFNAGRRVAYTQPLRLYIFASLLFFAANVVKTRPPTEAEIARANTEIAQIRNETAGGNAGAASKPEQAIPSAVPSALRRVVERFEHEDQKEVSRELQHLIPTMGFFCLPLLAMLLLVAYPRSGRVYVEDFVFALHLQAFYFLGALLTDIAQALAGFIYGPLSGFVNFLFSVAGVWLVYRAFRKVYGQGRWRTIFKMAFVGVSYGIILIVGIGVTAVAAALLVLGN
jgi:hypothetical protein